MWLYRSVATMNRKAPPPSLRSQKPTWDKAAELAQWELNQLRRGPRSLVLSGTDSLSPWQNARFTAERELGALVWVSPIIVPPKEPKKPRSPPSGASVLLLVHCTKNTLDSLLCSAINARSSTLPDPRL